jgi:predicted NAD-dependent protein-ADP-ribosyltransferase YbiA (DUF1768 family)
MSTKINWQQFCIHDATRIYGFFGEYRYLSNFYNTPVHFEGVCYPSSENAFQAAKIVEEERGQFVTCSAAESKNLWKTLTKLYTPEEWDKANEYVEVDIEDFAVQKKK